MSAGTDSERSGADRLRIAVTLTQCWHRVPGGTATGALRSVEALEATGQVDLVGVGPAGDLRRPSTWRSAASPGGPWAPPVPTVRLPLPLPLLYDTWARAGRPSIERATGPVDVVHLTVPMRIPSGRAPVVATVNDLFPLQPGMHPEGRGSRLMQTGLRWIRDHAARVVVPSDATARDCLAAGFPADRLRTVPYGVEPVVIDDTAARAVAERRGLRGPFVLFVGTLEPRKNLSALVAAMQRLDRPDVTLALIGPTGWGDADQLGEMPFPIARLGFVPDDELASLMRTAAVFCFPSHAEGFGLPVLEAMAAGAAVVTSSTTSTAEVAGGAALTVDPDDIAGLADAVASVLDDPTLSDRLRLDAVQRAASYRWDRTAAMLLDVYREVAS